jgi:hypothetical protein
MYINGSDVSDGEEKVAEYRTKVMDLAEFIRKGYLHEANRVFFHPVGLSLTILVGQDSLKPTEQVFFQDRRGTGGPRFGKLDRDKMEEFKKAAAAEKMLRAQKYGWVIEPSTPTSREGSCD